MAQSLPPKNASLEAKLQRRALIPILVGNKGAQDMPFRIGRLDQAKRAGEKQASRDKDGARLAAGEVRSDDLRRENGFFSSLPLNDFRLVSVGRRALANAK